ncbi:hypothetical protein [Paenibacillus thiaminolyticus]|uniref:hypothetical protein n=1 Tax=Paenibacillus thiaminolyticus TaxID=49283 RepID=UPI0025435529|nr:hypothetical protein [Paenibacillus thiaminolyticus]WII37986.1 hypothetical protein O0V01_02225 [Paenibacillus thiaminolyticus]
MNKVLETMSCGEMAEQTARPLRLFGRIFGEMNINDVPLAPGVRIDELKKGDDDPLEVVVEIPASRSKPGWNYRSQSLKDIDAVMTKTLNGFLSHQKPEDLNNQFLPPVTHWVGAKMVGEAAYFRGVVDPAAKDLKRWSWIRSNRINQVSIYGMLGVHLRQKVFICPNTIPMKTSSKTYYNNYRYTERLNGLSPNEYRRVA